MPANPRQSTNWSGTGKMRGGRSGVAFFVAAIKGLGVRGTYLLLIPVAIYFSFMSPDVPATMDFHRRIFGSQPWWKRRWLVFRHFLEFGKALVDRTAVLAGRQSEFTFEFEGEQHLRDAVSAGKGVLLLTAHVGNWEVAGQLLTRINAPVNVTGFDNEEPEVRKLLGDYAKTKFKMIPLTGSPTDAIPLVAALRRGEIVAMLGDRHYGSPSTRVPFLGGEASFPIGAYVLAGIADAPLVQVFSLRERGGHYHFFGFAPLAPQRPAHHARDAYLRQCATQFAANLERIVRRDPFQWFNFFPFWNEPAKGGDGFARDGERNSAGNNPSATMTASASHPN